MDMMQYEQTTRNALAVYAQLNQTYAFCIQHTLQKYGLYEGQPALLFKIREMRFANQNELAKALGVSKSSVGVSLRRLEKNGFVKREQDRGDSRCNRVTLTQKGQEFAHWCEMDMDMIATNMLEDFEGDEREDVVEVLLRMQKGLDAMRTRIKS